MAKYTESELVDRVVGLRAGLLLAQASVLPDYIGENKTIDKHIEGLIAADLLREEDGNYRRTELGDSVLAQIVSEADEVW